MHFHALQNFLDDIRANSTSEFDKGSRFELLIKQWLQTDPTYGKNLEKVWLWGEFPARDQFGGRDLGIDLVARTQIGRYWAIQCKCYKKEILLAKESVDSFIACSACTFTDPITNEISRFDERLWISTGESFGRNAKQLVKNYDNFKIIDLPALSESEVDWQALIDGKPQPQKEPKKLLDHQKEAVQKARAYFMSTNKDTNAPKDTAINATKELTSSIAHDRGQMIMACGTGKTFTALKIVEDQIPAKKISGYPGSVLFLSPSIGLVNQSLNAWMNDCTRNIQPLGVCSDSTATSRQSEDSFEDSLSIPGATTNPEKLAQDFLDYAKKDDTDILVIFSTYQSLKVVHEAQKILSQKLGYEHYFDFVICDEAHRTTGIFDSNADNTDDQKTYQESTDGNKNLKQNVKNNADQKNKKQDKSPFLKIHDADYIHAKKRLYMTATPKIYGETAKAAVKEIKEKDYELCSMDNSALFGDEFYRLDFGEAVLNNLLTDYKVLVLTVGSLFQLPEDIQKLVEDANVKELPFESAARLAGCVNALGKNIPSDPTVWDLDPQIMHRAILFCDRIGNNTQPSTSKHSAITLPTVAEKCYNDWHNDPSWHKVKVLSRHIDGSMGGKDRVDALQWLAQDDPDPDTCRVLCNVRCLGEGIDVPALDAAIFLASRKSPIDVVQAVGRVMRKFRKTKEKRFGYIIIPIVVNPVNNPDAALEESEYKRVWAVLRALRSHDNRFNAKINSIWLDKKTHDPQVIIGPSPIPKKTDEKNIPVQPDPKATELDELTHKLTQWTLMEQGAKMLYARMVEKVGSFHYWERWAKDIRPLAENLITRITELVALPGKHQIAFDNFLKGLQETVGAVVSQDRAIEMLAQHMITRPVFEALFADYHFVSNNAVSQSMEGILETLRQVGLEKDLAKLEKFYKSIKVNLSSVETLDGKQTIIKNLYDSFFKVAFPKAADQLGIVYTPIECVDFILRSVQDILQKELNVSLSDESVHILDPFTGTGTFITRLLQSGMIKKEDMERKYLHEIHCNEIVLLAYYVADVNIENTFHALTERKDYLFYDGICLTDTFTLGKNQRTFPDLAYFQGNSQCVMEQENTHIQVIIGNPPYSIGQRSANDNAQNAKYPNLDRRIEETYVAESTAILRNSLYDSYIRAFRWASDRLQESKEAGVISFITNAGWLNGNAAAGMRKCLEEEFATIYLLNLRGDARTSGELRRKECGNVFGIGSRAPVMITILVYDPVHEGKATIYYHDIGDYLSRDQKLAWLNEHRSLNNVEWITLTPDKHNDWLCQRSDLFESLLILGDKENKNNKQTFFESIYSRGVMTCRDAWVYNFSQKALESNIKKSINFYNQQCEDVKQGKKILYDSTKFSWDRQQKKDVVKNKKYTFNEKSLREALYRPFCRQTLYFDRELNNCVYQMPQLFPTPEQENLVICVSGTGAKKDFSCLITDHIPDLGFSEAAQCFPLYSYVEKRKAQRTLLGEKVEYVQKDGLTDFILYNIRNRFGNTRKITKEKIFYYVYGILHSQEYRERFQNDLKKSLPRIPIVERVEDFFDFAKAGEALAALHLAYESQKSLPEVKVIGIEDGNFTVEKMRFARTKEEKDSQETANGGKPSQWDKSTILFNSAITITNIPLRAYDYVVNGRSAIEWIMESYRVKTDKDSGIVNDPNAWAKEQGKPRYILDLLLSVITVSMKTLEIVEKLPKLELPTEEKVVAESQKPEESEKKNHA